MTLAVGAGVAYAGTAGAAAGSDNTIKACYSSSTTRIVDSTKCKSKEKSITWNKVGPAGPQGKPGPAGPQGKIGPKGDPGGSELRAGFCVVNFEPHTPAGVYQRECTYTRPFTEGCDGPVVVATPATLDDLDTPDDTQRWLPGTDYDYWLIGILNEGECSGIGQEKFIVNIRTLHDAGDRPIGIGFAYHAIEVQ